MDPETTSVGQPMSISTESPPVDVAGDAVVPSEATCTGPTWQRERTSDLSLGLTRPTHQFGGFDRGHESCIMIDIESYHVHPIGPIPFKRCLSPRGHVSHVPCLTWGTIDGSIRYHTCWWYTTGGLPSKQITVEGHRHGVSHVPFSSGS